MKTIKFLLAATLAALTVSCAKTDEVVSLEKTELTITATIAESSSKTTLVDEGTDIYWETSEDINVFLDGETSRFTSINTENSIVAKFKGTLSAVMGGGEGWFDGNLLWGLYPYRADALCDGTSVTTTLPSEQAGRAGSFAKNTNITVSCSPTTALVFYNVCGGVCFSLTESGVQDVTFRGNNGEILAGTIKVQFNDSGLPEVTEVVNGSTSIQLNAPTSEGFEVGKMYYISILPQTLSNGFTMEFNKETTRATRTVSSSVMVKRSVFGKLSNADQGLEYVYAVTDLSSTGTANCYIVSESGKYRFKPVKGCSSESVGTPASVEILWESFGTDVTPNVGDLVKKVSLYDGDVMFTASSKKGNAVIAVKDASGDILWSWHIWLTDQPDGQVYNNDAGTMMDRNLGACSATPGDAQALGLLYQWGRKDPFLSGSSKMAVNRQAASTLSWPAAISSDASNGTIPYSVAHPTTFIKRNINNFDWLYADSSSTDDTRWQTSDKTKGIYDPCPQGWRVPDGGNNGVWATAFGSSSLFSGGPWDSTNYGMNFGSGNGKSSSMQLGSASTIWYPAAGYLVPNGGSLTDVGLLGSDWSCTPGANYAYRLYIDIDGGVAPSDPMERASGRSVRCIKDESYIPQPGYVDLGLSVKWANYNIGASKPEEYGKYFAWGDVAGQTWDGHSWSGGGFSDYPAYEIDDKNNLKPEYDAAQVNLGGNWRMPTKAEWQELIDNCTSTWTKDYNGTGVKGRIFTSNKAGYTDKSIFLPAAGYGENPLYNEGLSGNYWTSTFDDQYMSSQYKYDDKYAWGFGFDSDGVAILSRKRYRGQPVRPVSK